MSQQSQSRTSQEEPSVGLDLERIVFLGRTWEEYLLMFNLSPEDMAQRTILDCPAGACAFTARANRHGIAATAADIAYRHPVDELEHKGQRDLELVMQSMDASERQYEWGYFRNVGELRAARAAALAETIADMRAHGQERYVPAELPDLPFTDGQFDLTLSAHFLFMYADRLGHAFHLATLAELMRVTRKEIRIFPTVDLTSRRYPHMDGLISFASGLGWRAQEVRVGYEFQKQANTLLKLTAQ